MVEKVIDRVVKLHKHAESAKQIGNEAEAQAFASMVQQLLEKHKLSMTDLEFENFEKEEPVGQHFIDYKKYPDIKVKKQIVDWIALLGGIVAKAHFCDIILVQKSSKIIIVGRKSDCEVAEYMFITLQRLAEKLADKAYTKFFYQMRDLGMVQKARGYRAAYLHGFLTRLSQRYEELRQQRDGTSTALVRINKSELAVKKFLDTLEGTKETSLTLPDKVHAAGYRDGKNAADKVSLNANALKENASRQKSLT